MPLPGKALLARLLLARIALQVGDLAAAEAEINVAVAKLSHVRTPVLVYQTHPLLRQIAGNRGDRVAAYAAYQEARKALEAVRTRLQSEGLKIPLWRKPMQGFEANLQLDLDTAN